MPRFFLKTPIELGDTVELVGEDAHHISYSLRMAVGEEITVTDSRGLGYTCRLASLDGTCVTATVLSPLENTGESPIEIHLFQAYPKSDKLEFIIQKAVELGVAEITPFESERCIKRPKADRIEHILNRQEKIACEAAKQCGRGVLPKVNAPISFDGMLTRAIEYPLALFCHPAEGTVPLRETLASHKDVTRIAIVVGSEGGFSDGEFQKAVEAGLTPTGLGARVLRCETAPLFLLSAISYEYEMKG